MRLLGQNSSMFDTNGWNGHKMFNPQRIHLSFYLLSKCVTVSAFHISRSKNNLFDKNFSENVHATLVTGEGQCERKRREKRRFMFQ